MDELEMKQNDVQEEEIVDTEVPLDKNLRLMSPGMMVVRRFFRSKLSIVGLIMVIGLFLFSFLGPVLLADTTGDYYSDYTDDTKWGELEKDEGMLDYATKTFTYEVDGVEHHITQVTITEEAYNTLARPSSEHILGTDKSGYDIFVRLMYGGRISLIVSFLAVFLMTIFGVILGGIAGYFGGAIDNIIMRICDILTCLPGVPILLIVGTALDNPSWGIDSQYRIYLLMTFLTFISWPGMARLVRGQILSLREQEYMVAAEAMGYSTSRKIFKHLVPNVMPQLIVQMSLGLGSMILYEATLSYLNLGVKAPYAAWGSMINVITTDTAVLENNWYVWVPAGVCIVIAVLGFNFVGDGLRDALDPKARR